MLAVGLCSDSQCAFVSPVARHLWGVPDRLLHLRRLGSHDIVAQGSGNLTLKSAWLPEQRLF